MVPAVSENCGAFIIKALTVKAGCVLCLLATTFPVMRCHIAEDQKPVKLSKLAESIEAANTTLCCCVCTGKLTSLLSVQEPRRL